MEVDYSEADCFYIGAFTAAIVNFPMVRNLCHKHPPATAYLHLLLVASNYDMPTLRSSGGECMAEML